MALVMARMICGLLIRMLIAMYFLDVVLLIVAFVVVLTVPLMRPFRTAMVLCVGRSLVGRRVLGLTLSWMLCLVVRVVPFSSRVVMDGLLIVV